MANQPCNNIPEADPEFVDDGTNCPTDQSGGSSPCQQDIFSLCPQTNFNYPDTYCCPFGDGVFADSSGGTITLHGAGCALPGYNFTFPIMNDENEPMLRSALGGTTQSPWVRIAFQQYCGSGINPDPSNEQTNATIITVGNSSQPCNTDICTASIKSFQYGWGTVNQGNKCKVTIFDESGTSFEEWAKRLVTNPEGSSKPILGVYRMKVQMGWYITGGASTDVCGQPSAQPGVPPGDGENTSYTICSPTMWFQPDMISVQYEGGKFVYELEGNDLLFRGQESVLAKVNGAEFENNMYFTEAVTKIGQQSFPPFRVRFLSLNDSGEVTSLRFAKRPGNANDDECLGPYGVWKPWDSPPLTVIQRWIINNPGIMALDQTGELDPQGNPQQVGITMNYDSTQDLTNGTPAITEPDWYDFNCETCIQGRTNTLGCQDDLPTVGTLILWGGNVVPNCQSSYDDTTMNSLMKAVYIVNGGNCYDCYSEILTEDGWNYIGNIYRKKYSGKVACVDGEGKLQWSNINNWYRNKLDGRKLIKVHLHNSRQRAGSISGAILTEDHPVLTNLGYVKTSDLNVVKHKIHSGTYMPSKEAREAITGMILGDANIRRKSYSFNCAHSTKQKEYIEHKAKLLDLKTISKPAKYPTIKITSKASPYWRSLRKLFYPDGIKIINNKILDDFSIISLAYLFMDDGYLSNKKIAEIATCGFTSEEVDLLIDKINQLGIVGYRRKNGKYPRIYFSVKQTKILSEKTAPYIIESMDYKILPEHRNIKKENLNLEQEPFYDNFDLIRCEHLESKIKYVYCIGVEKYENFITHSGVGHNCSPVIAFNPLLKWSFDLGLKAGGTIGPTQGTAQKQIVGSNDTNCAASGGRGNISSRVVAATDGVLQQSKFLAQSQKSIKLGIASNPFSNAVEAELRIQGDPSLWLCTPLAGAGRCVGIVFINPYFLTDVGEDCPSFTLGQSGMGNVCNRILTNKGWWIKGAEHQIQAGTYITTIRLALPAPGQDLEFTGNSVALGAGAFGAWVYGLVLDWGLTFANALGYPIGSLAATGTPVGDGCPAMFVGGGANCLNGQPCTEGMSNCSGTQDPNDDDTCDGFGGFVDGPNEDQINDGTVVTV